MDAVSQADLAESVAVPLTADGAAELPQALNEAADLDDRDWVAALPDLLTPRSAQAGVLLRQGVADERRTRVDGAGPTHAAADTARLVLHRGAGRLMVDDELRRDSPDLPALAAVQAPERGARRGRDHRPSSFDARGAPSPGFDPRARVWSSPTALGANPPQPGATTFTPGGSLRDRPGGHSPTTAHPRSRTNIRTSVAVAVAPPGAQHASRWCRSGGEESTRPIPCPTLAGMATGTTRDDGSQ